MQKQSFYCPKCGKEIDDENLIVCIYCGAELHSMPKNEGKKYNIFSAYRSMFAKMFDFKSRSGRGEYWLCYLANFIIVFIFLSLLIAIEYIVKNNLTPFGLSKGVYLRAFDVINYIYMVYSLVLFIPQLSLTVRRLHDTNRSAFLSVLLFAAPVGSLILAVLLMQKGTLGINRYGYKE